MRVSSGPILAVAVVSSISCFLLLGFTGCSGKHLVQRGERLEDQGKYLEAAVVYDQATAQYKGHPKKQSALQVRTGDVLLRGEHPQEALSAYEKAALLDSGSVTAHLRLAQLYLAAGVPAKAYDHLKNVLERQPNQPEAMAALGAYYVSIGEVSKAEQEFQQSLALEPQRQSTAVALADIYSTTGAIEKTREVLTRSAQANKTDPVAWMALGRLEEEQGNASAAERAYRNAVKAEDSQETNLRLAQHLLRSAKVTEAEAVLAHADSKQPLQSTSLADFELHAGHASRAAIHYQAVLQTRLAIHHDPAREETAAVAARVIEADLESASNDAGSDSRGGAALARLHLDQYREKLDQTTAEILETEIALLEGDLDRALNRANEAVASGPGSAAAYFVLGEVYKARQEEQAAVAEWNTAISKDPNYNPALLALAESELAAGQYSACEEQAAAVVRREPANLGALLLYARALAEQGNYTAARAIAARALAVARQSALPHLLLGDIEMKQRRPALALIQYQQAVILDPHSREALEGLTAVYRQGALGREAIVRLERSAEAPPQSSTLMEIAGRLYGDRHLYEDAARCFRRAMEIDRQRATAAMALAETVTVAQKRQAFDQLASLTGKLGGSADSLLEAVRAQDQNRQEQAIAGYEDAVRRGEITGVAANNLAWLYAQKGQSLDRALELAKLAHDRDPKNPAVMDTLGFVYLTRREYSQAVNVLKDAMQLARREEIDKVTEASLREHLAAAYAGAGENKNSTAN